MYLQVYDGPQETSPLPEYSLGSITDCLMEMVERTLALLWPSWVLVSLTVKWKWKCYPPELL